MARRSKYVRGSDPILSSQRGWGRSSRSAARSARGSVAAPARAVASEGPRAAVYGPIREEPRARREPERPHTTRGSANVHVNRAVLDWARTGQHRDMDLGQVKSVSPRSAQQSLERAIEAGAKLAPGESRRIPTGAYTVHDYGNRQTVHLEVYRRKPTGDIYVQFESEGT